MTSPKKVFVIRYYDPRSTEYHFDGREDICWDKGVFTDKGVAESVMSGMRMVQEADDPTSYTVRELALHEEGTLDEWMNNNAPWRQGRTG